LSRQSKTIFAGGKDLLCRVFFSILPDLVSAVQEGSGGMHGGFLLGLGELEEDKLNTNLKPERLKYTK